MSTIEIPPLSELSGMSRTELDALASDLGLDPADYANKAAIIDGIEQERPALVGDTVEATEAIPEATEYPAYMQMTPGERDETADDPDEPVSGFKVIPHHDRDPDDDLEQGDLISVNTDSLDETAIVRVVIETDEDEPRPVFQMEVPGFPLRTPQFNLGPGPLWPESADYGGNATFTLVTTDEDGNETEELVAQEFVKGEGEMPPAETQETPEIQTVEMLDPKEEEETEPE